MSFAAAAGGGAGVHASAACSLLFEEAERSGAKKMLLCGGTILGESTWFWKTRGFSKYSHGINVHKQLKLQKPRGVSYLKGCSSCPNESTWRRRRLHCLGSWVDAADAASASSDWKPVIDQVLLMATMFLTHMAGVAPFAKPFSKPAPMDLSYDPQVAAHNQTSSGSLENDKQLDSNCAWGIVKRKLIDSLNVVDLESNLKNLNVYDQQPLNRPLSLFAIPRGPRLRLLWTSFDQLQKEVHKIAGSLDTDNMLKWIPVFYEVVQNSSQSVCMDWLEKELSMKNISTDKEFFDLIAEKLEKDETILQNIRKSGKEGLYAELLCFLKFGSLREGCYYQTSFYIQHGVSILEDFLISLADGIVSIYLELISVDSGILNKMSSQRLILCTLSTRELQRLRNELVLKQWLHQNLEVVTSMYEDRFDICTFQPQLIQDPSLGDGSKSSLWKKFFVEKSEAVSSPLSYLVIAPFRVSVKRTLELRALNGWRYYFSLFLELSDIMIPVVKAIAQKVSDAISFLLVCLIGRSLGLIYSGIRQSLQWK